MSTGGVGSANLDTRLLRYRTRGGDENPIPLIEDLLAAGRTPEAQEVVGKALKDRPEDGELLLLDGRARLAAGDLLGAQASLLKSARVLPSSKGPFRWLGEVLLKRGDPGRAAKVLERARAIDPSDRAVQLLLDRAKRLDRVSEGAGDEGGGGQTQTQATYEPPVVEAPPPEERTVIRHDLTDHLRNLSREEPVPPPEPSSEEAYEVDSSEVSLTAPIEFTPEVPKSDAFYSAFEDEPTNLMDGRDLRAMAAPTPEVIPPAPRAPAKPKIQKTLGGFAGIPGAKEIPPPKQRYEKPAEPVRPPPAALDFEDDAPTNAAGALSFDARLAAKATSPGAAVAPQPPPPRRQLPSQKKPEPEPEPEPARIGAPSPWDDLSEEVPLDEPEPDPPPRPAPRIEAAPLPPPPKPAAFAFEPEPAPRASPAPAYEPAPVIPPAPRLPAGLPPAPEPAPPDPFLAADRAESFAAPPEPAPAPAPDVVVAHRGAEDVDEILHMLKREGLFEPPSGEAAAWTKRGEAKKAQGSGTRVGLWLGLVWVLAIGLVVGGYFGWQEWIAHRHRQAALLIDSATEEAYGGDHADLVDAERHLREARDLDPHDVSGPTLLLFVHSQRALEDGEFSAGYLRPAIERAETLEGEELGAYLDAARAVLQAAEGGHEQARARIAAALEARPRDPAILYLAGRLEQRLGGENALTHLQAATEGEASLNAPRVALAEARYDEGQAEEALALLDQVLANDQTHLRARLWRAFMTSDAGEPDELLGQLERIAEHLEDHGAPTDHVVYQLTRARLLRRKGQAEAAGEAVDRALSAGASEPRLLAVVAIEARRASRMVQAEHAARTAVTGAPSNVDFRKLLAEIQLARRNGRAALATLAELSADDPDVIEMRGTAALLLGTEEALAAAGDALDAYVGAHEDASVEVRALRIRIRTRQGAEQEMLPLAQALYAEAPGDPAAALALGEAALRARDAASAVEALDTVVTASPDDAEGHFLLGRARRMAADGTGARASFERAIELTPEHTEAKLALGGLLLDLGDYEAADTLYAGLARSSALSAGRTVGVQGRLGRVEALLGLGRLPDAQVQLEGVRAEDRESATYRVTAARLLLAQGQAGQALAQIRPLATGEAPGATVLALYGDALLAARQVEPAQEAYVAAVEADAGSPEALLGQADMAVRSERANDAIEILDRVRASLEQRLRPPSMHARMHTLYGRAHLLGRREDAARQALERAIEIPSAPPEAHFFLGEALSGSNSAAARPHYERYLELAPEGPFAARARRAIR